MDVKEQKHLKEERNRVSARFVKLFMDNWFKLLKGRGLTVSDASKATHKTHQQIYNLKGGKSLTTRSMADLALYLDMTILEVVQGGNIEQGTKK